MARANRGKWIIAAILGLSLFASSSALYIRYRVTRGALEFWGPQTADLISRAAVVETLAIAPAPAGTSDADADAKGDLTLGGRLLRITVARNVTGEPGLRKIRRSLCLSRNFDFSTAAAADTAWTYALRFSDGSRTVIVAFDTDCRTTTRVGSSRSARLVAAPPGLRRLLSRTVDAAKP